jgi:uncharacterized protein with HEPN domain
MGNPSNAKGTLRPQVDYVLDILRRVETILQVCGDLDEKQFLRSGTLKRATCRVLDAIGEASKHIEEEIRENNPHVQWRDLERMSDNVIHKYYEEELDGVVWKALEEDLPELHAQMEEIYSTLENGDRGGGRQGKPWVSLSRLKQRRRRREARPQIQYICDILSEMEYVHGACDGLDERAFLGNETLKWAVCRALQVIGMASKNIDEDLRNRFSRVEWKKMAGMRDVLRHRYFEVDYEIVWMTVTTDFPKLYPLINDVLDGSILKN